MCFFTTLNLWYSIYFNKEDCYFVRKCFVPKQRIVKLEKDILCESKFAKRHTKVNILLFCSYYALRFIAGRFHDLGVFIKISRVSHEYKICFVLVNIPVV